MEPGRVWDETAWRFHCGSEEEGAGKVSGTINRKGGQNFSIERILGQVRSAHLGEGGEEGREVDQGEEENDDWQRDVEGEGNIEEEDGEDEEEDEIINNQDHQMKNATVHLGLRPSSQASSNSRVQPILPRPPHLAAPPLNFCPRPSLLSQDPFLLSPLQSPRYTITEKQSCSILQCQEVCLFSYFQTVKCVPVF